MDGLEALRCMKDGGMVETPRYSDTVFRYMGNSLQIRNKGSDLWIDVDTPASIFLEKGEWRKVSEYQLTFAQAMKEAVYGATVGNNANTGVLYKMKDGKLWCMDACSFTVEDITKEEIEADWKAVRRERSWRDAEDKRD